jgi:hypothetical protein
VFWPWLWEFRAEHFDEHWGVVAHNKGGEMLIRPVDDGVILISQPAHAWVSGQLARAWGSEDGPGFEPFEEVCLAAEQHDIGWLMWETSPTLNPEAGLPHSFRELPRRSHLQIWGRARRYAAIYGRCTALLVSMHGTGLFERFGPGEDAPETERRMVDTFLKRERAAQHRLIESLASDPRYESVVQPEVLERNQALISIWDGLSLMLCAGVDDEGVTIGDYTLQPAEEANSITVEPWPFRKDSVSVFAEARRLTGRFERQPGMQAAINQAEQFVLEFSLVPATVNDD